MKWFFNSNKGDPHRVPLDGSQRARLVNMRLSRLIGYEAPQDLISKVHHNPGRLSDVRKSFETGFQRWFRRGMDNYCPPSLSSRDDDYQYWETDGQRTLKVKKQ